MPAIYDGCQFHCRDNSGCIPEHSRCDDFKDCADGSDEALCCKVKKGSSRFDLYLLSQACSYARCNNDWNCASEDRKKRKCDGVVDCDDMSDESDCCDVSPMISKSSIVAPRYPKASATGHRRVLRKAKRAAHWRAHGYNDDWLNELITMPTFRTVDTNWLDVPQITMPSFEMPTFPTVHYKHHNTQSLDSGAVTGATIFGFFLLGLMLAICRACMHRRNVRIRSISTQSLLVPENIVTDGSRVNSPHTPRRVGSIVLRSAGGAQGQDRGRRTVLVRTRSTSDLRSGGGQQATPSAGTSAASQQQQQQQQQNEHAQRTADALHLMVRDGPWLTTRTLRPMIPEQPNIPLFIEESNVRRLDDRRGLVVSTPPQLMMYVDGEFVWIPASRVPDALNFIALLSLQTEEGPSPAAVEDIQELPTVSVQQETVDTGGRCNVCLEDFNIDEQVRELPCHHLYHSDCIVPWLELNGTCPACREPISSTQQTDSAAGAHTTEETQ